MTDRTITTTATGEASAPPDEARVLLSASAFDPDPSTAREAVAEQARDLHEVLEDVGVPGDGIKTEQFSISQEWPDRRRRGPPDGGEEPDRPKPYHASQRIGVTVLDLDRLEDILVAAVDGASVGINTVNFRFRTDTKRELEHEAVADAVGAAREKAAAAVKREGGRLGDAVSIVTDNASRPQPLAMSAGDSASPSVTSGPMETRVRVEVTYEIEQDG